MKDTFFLIIFFLSAAFAFFGYKGCKSMCDSAPECACRNATPGDATCMDEDALKKWCTEQKDASSLPQCQL